MKCCDVMNTEVKIKTSQDSKEEQYFKQTDNRKQKLKLKMQYKLLESYINHFVGTLFNQSVLLFSGNKYNLLCLIKIFV